MTTPVLKSVRPDDWPDLINAGKAVVRFPNGIESGSWYNRPNDNGDKTAEYIRRDPAVLAELPEVRALADDLASCIAMIQHSIGAGKDVFIEPDTGKKLSDARRRLEAFRAAAIREARNG